MRGSTCFKIVAYALAFSAASALAQDHLVPEPSAIGGDDYVGKYQEQVATVLHEVYDRNVRIRMIAQPSFSAEYVVGIKDNSSIFVVTPAQQVWQYESLRMMEHGSVAVVSKDGKAPPADDPNGTKADIAELRETLPADYRDVKLDRCQIAIDPKLADRTVEVWKEILLQTRFVRGPEPVKGADGKLIYTVTVGLDGETYHFSMRDGSGDVFAGSTWSPSKDTKPAKLVEIAETMRNYCTTKNSDDLAKLSREVDALLGELHER